MSDVVEPIPVDAVIAQALEKRPVFPVGAEVWVRRTNDGVVEKSVVAGVCLMLTSAVAFHLHYLILSAVPGNPRHNRHVPRHHVHATYEEAMQTAETPAPQTDPIAVDISLAFTTTRAKLRLQQQRATP